MLGRNSLSFSNTAMMGKSIVTPPTFSSLGAPIGKLSKSRKTRRPTSPRIGFGFAMVRDLLAEHGYSFRVWTRSEIYAEPRLANVGLVLRYRCVDVQAAEREKIRRAFSSGAEPTLRTVSDTPGMTVAAVLRLVLEGILHIDWWEPLRLDSRVSGTPIGRQIWPVPLGCRSQEERCH
jgi:hypothetical protein